MNMGQMCGAMLAGVVFAGTALAADVTKEFDWCTVVTPDEVAPGHGFHVHVTLKKDLPDGQNLSVHMHHTKANGQWGGMYEWRPSQDPKPVGQASTFVFTAKAGGNVGKLVPVVFAATGGDWNKRGWTAFPNQVKVGGGASGSSGGGTDVAPAGVERPASVTFRKSWLEILPCDAKEVRSGEEFVVRVRYHLDASDNWGAGTEIMLDPLGPWVDCPDGVYTKSRQHIFLHGLWRQVKKIKPGDGVVEFTCSGAKGVFGERNQLGLRVKFRGGDGREWPWDMRAGGPRLLPDTKGYRLAAESAGGVYTYGETPVVNLYWGDVDAVGAAKKVDFVVYDCESNRVAQFSKDLVVGAADAPSRIALPKLARRGVMLVEASLADRSGATVRRAAAFATIPDVRKALGGRKAPLGCTNVTTPETAEVAAKVGFSYCRLFTPWAHLNPFRGRYDLDGLVGNLDRLNAVGIRPWVLLTGAPDWALTGSAHAPGFCAYPFDEKAWETSVRRIASACKGKVWGFEWLNEITQGDLTQKPVEDYVRFCRIGTNVLREVDPQARTQMAGGLWPRSYRLDLIRSGVLDAIDVLPVHYGSYGSVAEAIGDAKAGGCGEVWDNESARGITVWKMSPLEQLYASVTQCSQALRQWPGELAAGAKAITYFGGEVNVTGNWTYLLDEHTPRPVLATIAVFASKVGTAEPVGAVALGPDALAYLFRRADGKGLAFVMSANEGCAQPSHYKASSQILSAKPVPVTLKVGKAKEVTLTDYQGNERVVAPKGGRLAVEARPMPTIVEGFDLAALAAACSVSVAGQDALVPRPSVRYVEGSTLRVPVRVRNPLPAPVSGSVSLAVGEERQPPQKFALKPGEDASMVFAFKLIGLEAEGSPRGELTLVWDKPAAKHVWPFAVEAIRPDLLGNLLKNGDFKSGRQNWSLCGGKLTDVAAAKGGKASDPGMEGRALALENAKNYVSANQRIDLPAPGREYLYTAWAWTDMMYCGSNLGFTKKDGSCRDHHMLRVFTAPKSTKGWVLLTKRFGTDIDDVSVTFAPVGVGRPGPDGRSLALYRNVRVTVYDGTDYAAEADRRKGEIKIDGDLSDWTDATCEIPLLAENQVRPGPGYAWTPQNLSGVAHFAWDDGSLYFAARVKDDSHVVRKDGEADQGDAITLALHPGNRVPGTEGRAVEWILSTASPGGGSGKFTLYRPGARSGGLKSGQLAKDSSNYDLAIRRDGDICIYELRIPWNEVPGFAPETGATLGLSLRLTDRDENGAFGEINWGMGLSPAWAPSAFGALTLVP